MGVGVSFNWKETLKIIGSVIGMIACLLIFARGCSQNADHYMDAVRAACEKHKEYKWPSPEKKSECFRLFPELSR